MIKLDRRIRKIKFLREAAIVKRCHTYRVVGEYDVGMHTFNMLSLLRILHPDPSLALVWAVWEHDVPEKLTGDIPSPMKRQLDEEFVDMLETRIFEGIGVRQYQHELTDEEKSWLKGIDLLELAMFCEDQILLGNSNLFPMDRAIRQIFHSGSTNFPRPVLETYTMIRNNWHPTPDIGGEDSV